MGAIRTYIEDEVEKRCRDWHAVIEEALEVLRGAGGVSKTFKLGQRAPMGQPWLPVHCSDGGRAWRPRRATVATPDGAGDALWDRGNRGVSCKVRVELVVGVLPTGRRDQARSAGGTARVCVGRRQRRLWRCVRGADGRAAAVCGLAALALFLRGAPRPKGRRYSGFAPWAGSAVALPGLERLSRLVANGVPAFFVGKSLFAMPKLVRHLARAGLCGVDLDQDNAHPRAMLKRHAGAAPCLATYVRDREEMLAATDAR